MTITSAQRSTERSQRPCSSSLSEQHASSIREQELRSALAALERAHARTTLEHLVEADVATTFSHGICDTCLQRESPDFAGP